MAEPVVIFDNGSGYLKAGLSNVETPSITMPALIGRPMLRFKEKLEDIELKEIMIGDEVIPVRPLLELTHPMKEGIIVNEEDMATLWDYCIRKKLKIEGDLKDRKILLTEAPYNPIENKLKMAEIVFEKLGFGYFNIETQAKLTLYCEGKQTGIILDSGDGVTHCIPIYEDFILPHNIRRSDIAGRHITDYLIKLLQRKGYAFNSSADFELVREIKEKYCFVSCDIDSDRKLDKETTFYNSIHKLPDGRKIRISNEKFEAPEILFNPYLLRNESPGIHEMLYDSISACDIDIRAKLYKNIILSGATTMFPGFASRMHQEINNVYVEKALSNVKNKEVKITINVIDSPRRKYSVFIGATVLANIFNENGEKYWITKQDYKECGEKIIRSRCPNITN